MIPEAAVEAAAKAVAIGMWGRYDPDDVPYYLNAVREILEAAAPHIAAQAWESGYRACDREWEQTADIVTPDEDRFVAKNPYRPAK